MALTGTFNADFKPFTEACAKAEIALKGIDAGAGTVSKSLTRMSESLSGTKVIQQAILMAEAVERVGGVSRLTEKELARVGVTAQEAATKLTALGQTVPPGIQRIADAAHDAANKTQSFAEQVKAAIPTQATLLQQVTATAAGYISGTLALQGFEKAGRAVVGFLVDSVKAFTQSEDSMRRLTTALQAQGTASSTNVKALDDLAKAYQRTTVNSDEALRESEALLIQVGNVMPSQMDKALKATTDLAAGMGIDLRSATMLVSKAFEDNFAALKKAGIQIDEAKAQLLGFDYVAAQIEQRFGGQAQSQVQSYAGQVEQLKNLFDDFQEEIGGVIVRTGALQTAMLLARLEIEKQTAELRGLKATADAFAAVPGVIGAPFRALGFGLKDAAAAATEFIGPMQQAKTTTTDYAAALHLMQQHLVALTPEMRANLTAALAINTNVQELTKTFHLSAGEIDLFKKQLEAQRQASEKAAQATKQHAGELQKVIDSLSGSTAAGDVQKLATAVGNLTTRFGGLSSVGLAALSKQLADLRAKGADVTPVLDAMNRAQISLALVVPESTEKLGKFLQTLGLYGTLAAPIPRSLSEMTDKLKALSAILPKTSTDMNSVATAVKAAFGIETRVQMQITADNLQRNFMAMGASGQYNAAQFEDAARKMVAAIKAAHGEIVPATVDWGKALGELTTAYAQLAQIAGDSFGGIGKATGLAIANVNVLQKAFEQLTGVSGSFNKESTHSLGSMVALGASMLSVASAMYTIGNALFDMYLENQKSEAQFREHTTAVRLFGGALQQSTIEAISKSSRAVAVFNDGLYQATDAYKDLIAYVGQPTTLQGVLDLQTIFGAASNLKAVIQDLGGVSAANYEQVVKLMGVAEKIVAFGGETGRDALKSLNDGIKELGDYAEKSGGLWDDKLKQLVADTEKLGLTNAKLLIVSQTDKATQGLGAFLTVGATAYDTIAKKQKELADLQEQYADASAAQAPKLKQQIDETTAAIETQRKILQATAVTSQQSATAFGATLFGSFALALKEGQSFTDAIASVGPGVTALQKQLDATGLHGGAAFDKLQTLVALMSDEVAGPALTAVSGLNQGLIGLSNTGLMNQETFEGLADQVGQTYDALISQGKDGDAALAAMQPTLQTIWELEQKYGYTVDDSTQALIDQAEQQGIVGEGHASVAEQMLKATKDIDDAVRALAHVFGAVLPGDMDKAATAGADAARNIKDEMNKIPKTILIDVNYKPGTLFLPPSSVGPGGGLSPQPLSQGGRVGYFASGGAVAPVIFTPRGTDTQPAMLTPGELVLTRDQARDYLSGAAAPVSITFAPVIHTTYGNPDDLRRTVRTLFPAFVDELKTSGIKKAQFTQALTS